MSVPISAGSEMTPLALPVAQNDGGILPPGAGIPG
jgi:hypothetical protein